MQSTQIEDGIKSYLEGTASVIEALACIRDEINITNQTLSDIDHFLELEDLEDNQLLNLVCNRKKILEKRRGYKDYLTIIENILPTQIEGRTTHDRYENTQISLGKRVYTPRQVTLNEVVEGSL